MKMPWNREAVHVLPTKIDLTQQTWCREALLLHVRGTGALRWETRTSPPDADPYETDYCLTLRSTPLLSWHSAVWETSESWLATGWGLDSAECSELEILRETLNGAFTCLEDAIPALSPLLELLPSGLYVLAESDAYPADGGGRFFWDVPDQLTCSAATASIYLSDDDYRPKCLHRPPVFLYPSQRRSRLDMDRVMYYRVRLQHDGPLPHGIAINVTEGMSVLMDGHHKAAAAALLGRTLPCLTVLRLTYYELSSANTSKEFARFGPILIPVKDISCVQLPKVPWKFADGSGSLPAGHLADTELPEELLANGKQYPTAKEHALVLAAEISYPTDEDLNNWLAASYNYRPQLRAALVLLRNGRDPRLKKTALQCASMGDHRLSLIHS